MAKSFIKDMITKYVLKREIMIRLLQKVPCELNIKFSFELLWCSWIQQGLIKNLFYKIGGK